MPKVGEPSCSWLIWIEITCKRLIKNDNNQRPQTKDVDRIRQKAFMHTFLLTYFNNGVIIQQTKNDANENNPKGFHRY